MESAREARLHLRSDVACLGEGRRFVARTLRDWDVDAARIESVTLVANELVANAIVHAHSAPMLSLSESGDDLVLHVADNSCVAPVLQTPGRDEFSGRGLRLVDALADRWGVDIGESGKSVWVAFAGAFDAARKTSKAP